MEAFFLVSLQPKFNDCTSFAPAFLSSFIIGPTVFPLTIESSTKITLFPNKFSVMTPNFLATASCRDLVSGNIKDLPTYLFLHKTSANGIPD